MEDPASINPELIQEISALKRKIRQLEQSESECQRATQALQESEKQYRALVENASDLVYRLDSTGYFTFVNLSGLRITGYEEEELIGKNYSTLIRPDRRDEAIRFFGRQFVKKIENTYSEYPILTKEGHEVWLGQNTRLIMEDDRVIGFQSVSRDITERKRVEEELRRNHDLTERLVQEIAIIAEIGKVVGSTLDTEEVYDKFAAEVRKLIPFDRLSVNLHDIDRGIVRTVYVSGEYVAGRQSGEEFPLKGSVSEVLVNSRTGMFSSPSGVKEMDKRFPDHVATIKAGMRSILSVPLISRNEVIASLHFRSRNPNIYTEQDLRLAERIGEQIAGAIVNAQLYAGLKKTEQELKESEQRYRELSIIDDLTQLYNSRHFYYQLKIELDRSNRYQQPLTLLLLDLDNFKIFNDTYGHIEGDQVLIRLGQVFKRCIRETDFAYRCGGEEFTVLLPMTTSAEGAVTAERIRTEFRKETFSPAPGQNVHVTVSIGLAQYKPKEEMKAFVHRVDQLMYQGKKNGRDRVCSES
jgi:diguanylate cyclase (GGDEF)-like protein/PAS domain S-box-containing protein